MVSPPFDEVPDSRYSAIDPAKSADKCTCGKPDCPRGRLLPFRDHISALYRVLRNRIPDHLESPDPQAWEAVLFQLLMAASITDVVADTSYVEEPMVLAVCEPVVGYENGRSEMASKYVAAASIFHYLWLAYEAAVSATATGEFADLQKKGRLGERGRRLFESRPDASANFEGLVEVIGVGMYWCEVGEGFDVRLSKIRDRFNKKDLVLAAELCREFRNFLVHGEDQVPDHPNWGDPHVANARFFRFYALGRLLLYLIQALAWISILPGSQAHQKEKQLETPRPRDPRKLFSTLQFKRRRGHSRGIGGAS